MEAPTSHVMKFSSVAKFHNVTIWERRACYFNHKAVGDSDFVRIELLANPSETGKLAGVAFELLGGPNPKAR